MLKLKIRHKLFLTLFITSALVAGGLFFFLQWSFDRGFLNYINSQELRQLDVMAEELATFYRKTGSWMGLQDNHFLWMDMQRQVFRPKLPENAADLPTGPPPPHEPSGITRRLVLLDGDGNRIIGGGPFELESDFTTLPIQSGAVTVGHLGLIPITEVSSTGELRFVKEQQTTFALVAVMMLAISTIFTFPVAIHLLQPINSLTEGTMRLIGGKFSTRIPVTRSDELGRLSEHFNILAMTLEKNEDSRRRWIADISHELRTPLAVLRGELEALLDGIRSTGPETLEPLHGEILHMERLVGDLYELSMSDIGALTYRKVPMDAVGILQGAVELFEKRYAEKGLEIVLDIPGAPVPLLLGDPDRMQQLFSNLLENSLKYTDAPGTLTIRIRGTDRRITFSFEDSAPGVTAEQLPLLFERLYRTDPSRQKRRCGAGLGLAICTNIVEAHQGTISSYNSPEGGLGIRVELPVTA